ncbi:MAG TPA: hypothetical protein VLA75_03860, partial [Thermoanaerobaculia bacterium]|nr:hypothetical protein [Thermoanaerobaculia bacterium]
MDEPGIDDEGGDAGQLRRQREADDGRRERAPADGVAGERTRTARSAHGQPGGDREVGGDGD